MISAIGLVAMFKRRGFYYITCMFCEMNYDYDQYLVLHTEFLCVCACKGYWNCILFRSPVGANDEGFSSTYDFLTIYR